MRRTDAAEHSRIGELPVHVLREYSFVADGERGALIGPRGDVAFLCVPTWDSDAVFSNLIGGPGVYAVTPADRYTWGGYYDPRSLIWNSRWVTNDGVIESRDALAMPADPDVAVLLRRIRVLEGSARIRVVLDVRAAFGAGRMQGTHRHASGLWTGRSGAVRFRWTGADGAHRAGPGPLVLDLVLRAGDHRDLVLELGPGPFAEDPPSGDDRWCATEDRWREAVPQLEDRSLARRDAEQSMAVLRGLTGASGGMVAAATMSLPERVRSGRNYDYRYAWIRDQCYAGHAVAAHGHFPLLDAAVQFCSERILADGPTLKPAYTLAGGAVPGERELTHLQGYPGGADRVGNHVNRQFQLDALGEILELLAAAASHERLEATNWKAVQATVAAIEERWGDADAGVWELGDQRWAHSRLTCISGLRAIAAEAPATESGRWSALADAILADVAGDCLHPSGRWQRAPGDERVDAALLLPVIRRGLPTGDPRSDATVAAVAAELLDDGYVYRFRQDPRPLGEAEGAFLLCGFLLALARHLQGDAVGARALFERNRSACGSPGLLSEEFDVEQRQLRGNLPQAFVHAMLLETSAVLTPRE